jgi:hypothetical protein
MKMKTLEIRDAGTLIMAVAIEGKPETENERLALDRCGFPKDGSSIILMSLYDQRATNDPYDKIWFGSRTMAFAHNWIIDNWATVNDGDLIDVEFLEGKRDAPKLAEVLR